MQTSGTSLTVFHPISRGTYTIRNANALGCRRATRPQDILAIMRVVERQVQRHKGTPVDLVCPRSGVQ